MMRSLLVLVALIAVFGVVANGQVFTTQDLAGSYSGECSFLGISVGEDEYHFVRDYWFTTSQVRFHDEIYTNSDCDSDVLYEVDSSAFITLGPAILNTPLPEGTQSLLLNYREGMKRIRVFDENAGLELEEICEGSITFPNNEWVDITDANCPPLYFGCSEDGHAEWNCVNRDADGNLEFCSINTELGACQAGNLMTELNGVTYTAEGAIDIPSSDAFDGSYGFSCVEFPGLPEGWRLSEDLDISGGDQERTSYLYNNARCDGRASVIYTRTQNGVNGPVFDEFSTQRIPTFKQEQVFVSSKVIRLNDLDGKNMFDALCNHDFPLYEDVDVSTFSCPPFLYQCGFEALCVHQDPFNDNLYFCNRGASGSCSDDERVAQYFPVVYVEGDDASSSAATLAISFAFVAVALMGVLF